MRIIVLLFILKFACVVLTAVYAQTAKPPKNWHLNAIDDTISGTNVNKVYSELIKGKTPKKKIIVAVIDGGTDYKHEDLKDVIWKNKAEQPNGKDDDNNGYIDDFNGWNFLGGPKGDQLYDNLEYVRIIKMYKPVFENRNEKSIGKDSIALYRDYQRALKYYNQELKSKQENLAYYEELLKSLKDIKSKINSDTITLNELEKIKANNSSIEKAIKLLDKNFKAGIYYTATVSRIMGAIENTRKGLDYHLNLNYSGRENVNDNYFDVNERYYGNNNTDGPDALHGTAVAGCIAALRNNQLGIDGITNDVEILIVRAVPDGDERDKDVANAIRYSVDQGASIINMSFGKAFTTNKQAVDEAIKYAESKDVLLVHAAGNDGKFIDEETHYPSNFYGNNRKTIKNMITVGACDYKKNPTSFSNYGSKSVDVFAPGKDIYTTFPNSKYGYINGTSFACPITAGIAALIRTYYPELSASEVKNIIIKSAYKINYKVQQPGNTGKMVKYKTLCKSGGVVDAYKAMLLAEKKSKKK